ncbi:MAG: hypothetical protein ABII26_01130 [Pseudomonadota bacterium]
MGNIIGLERRFGVIAVKKGFISAEQLFEALKIQVTEDLEGKKHRSIGTILHDEGFISFKQVNEVRRSLTKPLYDLQP